VRLDEVALDVRRLLGGTIAKTTELSLHTGDDAPSVIADPGQLRQVLMNLVLNAVDAIGSRAGHVELRAYTADAGAVSLDDAHLRPDAIPERWAILEVQDDGEGMDEATRRRVFEPFFTTKEHGRGLGLAALLGIVRAHGGAVRVVSRPGAGTTFQVLLPAPDPALEQPAQS
jgi:two-component system cell cycle sensor histidine kinase/response regulator CckA